MKKVTIVIIGVLIIAFGFIALNSDNNTPAQQSDSMNFTSVQSYLSSGAKLYDVRTAQEYASGHFENAENWSLQDMHAGKMPELPETTKIYVYCQSGNRSSQAAMLLRDAGFSNVTDLGGLQDVKEIGGKLQ